MSSRSSDRRVAIGHRVERSVVPALVALWVIIAILAVLDLPDATTLVLVGFVVAGVIGWFPLRAHRESLCERCIGDLPDNDAAINKHLRALRTAHVMSDVGMWVSRKVRNVFLRRVAVFLFLYGTQVVVKVAVYELTPASEAIAMAVGMGVSLMIPVVNILAFSRHAMLAPWCPWCRGWDGGDERETTPGPVPMGTVNA